MKVDVVLTMEQLNDIITGEKGPNVIGSHIWVEDLERGVLYAAIVDMDIEGIVAIWSVNGVYREVDYGKTWVAYQELSEVKLQSDLKPFAPFAVGKEREGWDVEFDDSDDEDDGELIDLAKERLARFKKRR